MLSLKEQLVLLCLDDESGAVTAGGGFYGTVGVAACCLFELAELGRIDLDGEKVKVLDPSPTGDVTLDSALKRIVEAKKPATIESWASTLYSHTRVVEEASSAPWRSVVELEWRKKRASLFQTVVELLVRKEILRIEKSKILWIFPVTRYPEENARPEQQLRQRIDRIVLGGGEIEDEQTAVLLGLVHACEMEKPLFGKENAKAARERIDQLTRDDILAGAARKTIEQVRAAIVAASIAATTASTTAVIVSN